MNDDGIIAYQARLIYKLTKENEELKDEKERRNEWLRDAKREAGYDINDSFDKVWEETLEKAKLMENLRE